MDNAHYNSLTEKLISDGIISSENGFDANLFNAEKNENLKNITSPQIIHDESSFLNNKKRINDYDMELINNSNDEQKTFELFIEKKQGLFLKVLSKFFPRIYRAKLAKKAMQKFLELDIDTSLIFDKTIPYGESEIRYKHLVKYIKHANELQVELNKKEIK